MWPTGQLDDLQFGAPLPQKQANTQKEKTNTKFKAVLGKQSIFAFSAL